MNFIKPILVCHTGNNPNTGGIQNVTFEVNNAFSKRKIEYKEIEAKNRFYFLYFCCLSYFYNFKRFVFFTHLGLAQFNIFLFFFSRNVVFLHGIECWKKFSGLKKLSLLKTEKFLVNSRFTWEKFINLNPDFQYKPFKIVPLGLGISLDQIPRPSCKPIAVILGRLSKKEDYKGHRQIILVWQKVRFKVPGSELWIVGSGDQLEELKILAGNSEGIIFFGNVSLEKKEDLLCQSRCLVMPSKGEGFGLVYLEAMRLGRPCLVSDQDAGREVVNPPECGLEVDPDSSDRVVNALEKLLILNEAWEVMSENAKKRYDRYFTAGHFHDRFLKALL